MKRPWKQAAIFLFLLALIGGGLFGDRVLALTDEARDTLRVYTDLVTVAHQRYGGEVSYRDLVYASIQGMLRELDPHTSFLPPKAYTGMRERQQSSFYGLGILVGVRNGQLTVISPIEGTPASRLGMRAGDIIDTIEGEPTEQMSLDEAVDRLKGPKDTEVNITIVRRGLDEPLQLAVTRAEIPQTTVRLAYMLDERTGYMQISDFGRGTGHEVSEALDKLRDEGMERLLVDLRNNGGGLLDQAIEVADQFLGEGSQIVETRGRTRDSFQSFRASDKYPDLELPVIMLVNRGTASAAEILSGAVQDHDVGLVVGTPTWGKGLVQTVYSLSYGAGLALTTAKYYTPSGRLIQRDYSSFFDYYNYDPLAEDPRDAVRDDLDPSEIFTTDLGREVYGGGGITPDVIVEPNEFTPFQQYLFARSAYFGFAVDYASKLSKESIASWQPPPELIAEFESWLIEEDIATRQKLDEELATDDVRALAVRQIHGEILNSALGQEARHRVVAQGDEQILKALQMFDQAGDLLARRLKLDQADGEPRQTAQLEEAGAPQG
ncbi:MAG: S41 family peptidase [Acidobacteriota bacterium]